MIVCAILIFFFMCSNLGAIAHSEEDRVVTINIENHSPQFEVAASILNPGGGKDYFAPAARAQNVLERTIPLTNDWFTDLKINIVGKIRTERQEFGHWVQLRLTRDFQWKGTSNNVRFDA
jgi:hypothetical protein